MKRGIIIILLLLVSLSFISAAFVIGDLSHDVSTIYGPGSDVQGWINLSISNEPVSSLFEDTEDNVISLIDLLKSDVSLEQGVDYNCSVPECGLTYEAQSETSSFSLSSGESKLIGFKLNGNINDITSVSFDIDSNAGFSCNNQLEIDFFDDGIIEHGNDKASDEGECSHLRNYGCFDFDETADPLLMDLYCQKIRLSKSPGFKLGAWLEIEEDAEITKIGIYDLNNLDTLAECVLNNSPTTGEERYCNVDFLVTKAEDYYVCIGNDVGADVNTKIRGYADDEGCGFYVLTGTPDVEDYAYQIFAEGRIFAPIDQINITETYPFTDGLSDEFLSYIFNEYNGYDCSDDCIIPIKLTSGASQDISINDVSVLYTTTDGPKEETAAYNVEQIASTINSDGFIQISLSNGNFTLPTQFGSFDYTLDLDDIKIFEKTLIIEKVPEIKYITPSYGFNGIPIDFTVRVNEINNASIISYVWEFGNATPITTTTNTARYTFANKGNFPIKISVTDENGKKASKTFYIEVKSYLLYFNDRVEEVKDNLDRIEDQMSNMSLFIQQGIKEIVNPTIIRQQLDNLSIRYNAGEYEAVITEFLELESRVPESIYEKIDTNFIPYFPSVDYIDVGIISQVTGETYDNSKTRAYKEAVLDWHVENIDSKVKYNQIMADYIGDRSEPILNVFDLDINKIGNGPANIFIRQLDNINFDQSYGESLDSGYISLALGNSKRIKFYTTQDVGIKNLPAFISPAISELTIIEDFDEAEVKRMRWLLFFLILFFLIIAAIIVYIALQQWYKYKYENYLFKDRNYLFNLVHYVDAQKKKGVKDSEIIRKLKKAGWNSEQINYVMKKYAGKRTGMLEIPVEKVLGLFRKKSVQKPGMPPVAPPRRS